MATPAEKAELQRRFSDLLNYEPEIAADIIDWSTFTYDDWADSFADDIESGELDKHLPRLKAVLDLRLAATGSNGLKIEIGEKYIVQVPTAPRSKWNGVVVEVTGWTRNGKVPAKVVKSGPRIGRGTPLVPGTACKVGITSLFPYNGPAIAQPKCVGYPGHPCPNQTPVTRQGDACYRCKRDAIQRETEVSDRVESERLMRIEKEKSDAIRREREAKKVVVAGKRRVIRRG